MVRSMRSRIIMIVSFVMIIGMIWTANNAETMLLRAVASVAIFVNLAAFFVNLAAFIAAWRIKA